MIILYVLFALSCTILQFVFVCSALWLFFCTDKNTLRHPQCLLKCCQLPLPTNCRISRANGKTTNPESATLFTCNTTSPIPVCLFCPSQPYRSKPIYPILQSSALNTISPIQLMPWLMIHPPRLNSQQCWSQSIISPTILPLSLPYTTHYLIWREPHKPSTVDIIKTSWLRSKSRSFVYQFRC